ncbi:hypothetical protein NPIL_226091 [Nephila pilipes]|uniref:C2H2-type domain-containing protein n=1 Tax=Nephila pilipes TaxID=299642 RepID=A0A8X6QVB7_NEPPI|nr:hypothetical protein NPIL_226091 [Nephila pilipes]
MQRNLFHSEKFVEIKIKGIGITSLNRQCWSAQERLNITTKIQHRFQCIYCSYGTASNADLKKHHLTHTGERPHACHICGRRFSLKENLKRHSIVHLRNHIFNSLS